MSFFAYSWVLAGIIPAGVLICYYLFRKPQPGIVLPDISRQGVFAVNRWQLVMPPITGILFALALVLLIIATARPRLGDEKFIMRRNGIDMVMVLDLSGSMASYDVPDNIKSERQLLNAIKSNEVKNRLDAAKAELTGFIRQRPNDRIGLIGFAEFGYNLSPPTWDHDWLISSLEMLEPGIIGDGTGIASPVASAIRRLENSNAPRRVMVLFTDGVNNVAHRLTPQEAALLAREKEIIIYTVGIGGNVSYGIQESFFGNQLVRLQHNFDEDLLKEMASVTGGKYFRAADQSAMQEVMQEINQLEKTDFEQPRYIEYQEYAPLIAALAMMLIVMAIFCENTFERSIP